MTTGIEQGFNRTCKSSPSQSLEGLSGSLWGVVLGTEYGKEAQVAMVESALGLGMH